jgi:phosphoribosyl-AMP cyclohydrolase
MNSNPFNPRTSHDEIETGLKLQPKFGHDGLISCITADADSGEVLMFSFMNAEALRMTIETGKATYYSRSRKKLWIKGEESGNVFDIREIKVDCDQDVILITVDSRAGAACHRGFRSCFYRKVNSDGTLEHTGGKRLFDPEVVYRKK